MSAHPGAVEMVDEDSGTSEQVAAAELPAAIAFVGGVPVVRVVKTRRGEQIIVRSFGADGQLLASTVGTSAH